MRENREQKLATFKEKNLKFKNEWFGEAELMPTDLYPEPPFKPKTGMHPRVIVNKENICEIKRAVNDKTDKYGDIPKTFWAFANTEDFDGRFAEEGNIIPGPDGDIKNRYSQTALAIIEAKALAYLLTGDELYGYEAIVAVKNAMLTLRYWRHTNQDTYHGAAHVIDMVSFVYDWCYPLLTEQDKRQLIGGTRTKLLPQIEFFYPPVNMGAVSGHGTGLQMFRTWMSLAAAVADERPDFWSCVAGRFYSEYVPVVKYMFSSGFVPQGPTNYGTGKFYGYLYSALLLRSLGDDVSYGEGITRAPYTIISNIMPNGMAFQTGDANNGIGHLPNGCPIRYTEWTFLSAALTRDPTFLVYARDKFGGFNEFVYENGRLTPALAAICIAACNGDIDDLSKAELDPITYNGHPGGQTVIRSRFGDESAPMVMMKVGDRTMANHEHCDSGHFIVYYKGLLASDSGWYTGTNYGKPHWKYYQHATVSHNCPLVYDPDAATLSPDGIYYSGGQRYLKEAKVIEEWNGGNYDVGKILAHAEGRSADGKEGKYAYIAGDITNAYEKGEVEYLGRSMLTVMRENKEIPAVTFIYDDITSVNPKAIKKFLLHTPKESYLDEKTKTVTTENAGGRLTAVPLIGIGKAELIGGADKEFWVGEDASNGINIADSVPDKYRGTIWGRAEYSVTGNKTDKMLYVLYVGDAGSNSEMKLTAIESDSAIGGFADDIAAVFAKSRSAVTSLSFEVCGGKKTYYVGGLAGGEWQITVNGERLEPVFIEEENHFAVFEAGGGAITLSLRV